MAMIVDRGDDARCKAQHQHHRVNVTDLAQLRIVRRAIAKDLDRLGSGEPANHVNVVDDRVVQEAAGRQQVRQVAVAAGLARRDADLVHVASGTNQLARTPKVHVRAALEAAVEREVGLGGEIDARLRVAVRQRQRLLAEHMLASRQRLGDQLAVRARGRGDDDGIDLGIVERLVALIEREHLAVELRLQVLQLGRRNVDNVLDLAVGVRAHGRGAHLAHATASKQAHAHLVVGQSRV